MSMPSIGKQTTQINVEAEGGAVSLARILVALDASEYSDRALEEAVRLSNTADGEITGIHAYAALLHDRRFKQMEGGLPERYLEEEEMMYQRDVHDDLIGRGLNIISDSYHDVAAVGRQPSRDGAPDATATACDQGYFSIQFLADLRHPPLTARTSGPFRHRAL